MPWLPRTIMAYGAVASLDPSPISVYKPGTRCVLSGGYQPAMVGANSSSGQPAPVLSGMQVMQVSAPMARDDDSVGSAPPP
jgi:hypothetical protein